VALKECVEESKQSSLICGGELVDQLDATQEPAILDQTVVFDLPKSEDFVRRNPEDLGEAGDQGAVEPDCPALVVRNEGLIEAELGGDFGRPWSIGLPLQASDCRRVLHP
jgi:hypothetical protein